MLVGGIDAHRYDLSSMVMLKDNHIWSKGAFGVTRVPALSLQHPQSEPDSTPAPDLFASLHSSGEEGSITQAVAAARSVAGFALRIEVEVSSLDAAREAISSGADIVMLDNLEGAALKDVAAILKKEHREALLKGEGGKGFLLESSGGIEEDNLNGRISNGQSASAAALASNAIPVAETDRPSGPLAHLFPDIDIISTSVVHQSVQHIDFSLKIRPGKQ